jgi:hypothetical protein
MDEVKAAIMLSLKLTNHTVRMICDDKGTLEEQLPDIIVFLMKQVLAIKNLTNTERKTFVKHVLETALERLIVTRKMKPESRSSLFHVGRLIDMFHALDTGRCVIEGVSRNTNWYCC